MYIQLFEFTPVFAKITNKLSLIPYVMPKIEKSGRICWILRVLKRFITRISIVFYSSALLLLKQHSFIVKFSSCFFLVLSNRQILIFLAFIFASFNHPSTIRFCCIFNCIFLRAVYVKDVLFGLSFIFKDKLMLLNLFQQNVYFIVCWNEILKDFYVLFIFSRLMSVFEKGHYY